MTKMMYNIKPASLKYNVVTLFSLNKKWTSVIHGLCGLFVATFVQKSYKHLFLFGAGRKEIKSQLLKILATHTYRKISTLFFLGGGGSGEYETATAYYHLKLVFWEHPECWGTPLTSHHHLHTVLLCQCELLECLDQGFQGIKKQGKRLSLLIPKQRECSHFFIFEHCALLRSRSTPRTWCFLRCHGEAYLGASISVLCASDRSIGLPELRYCKHHFQTDPAV